MYMPVCMLLAWFVDIGVVSRPKIRVLSRCVLPVLWLLLFAQAFQCTNTFDFHSTIQLSKNFSGLPHDFQPVFLGFRNLPMTSPQGLHDFAAPREAFGPSALATHLRRFGSFGGRRPRCWQQLLELPGNAAVEDSREGCGNAWKVMPSGNLLQS